LSAFLIRHYTCFKVSKTDSREKHAGKYAQGRSSSSIEAAGPGSVRENPQGPGRTLAKAFPEPIGNCIGEKFNGMRVKFGREIWKLF
jgi:hypothetical protein